MTHRRFVLAAVVGVVVVSAAGPVGAQDEHITVTPADGLVDGDGVTVSASTVAASYATVALCPADAAPAVGTDPVNLLSLANVCVGLACFGPEEEQIAGLTDLVRPHCPVSTAPSPISSVEVTVALPRVTADGTDCAVEPCVVVVNTWTTGAAQGAVSAPVTFDESVPPPPSIETAETTETTTTTTTIALSAPTTVAAPAPTAAPTTVPTQVLGTTETNDELALTGFAAAPLAALGLALVAAGAVATSRGRAGR